MITIHRYAGATPEYLLITIQGMRNSWESWEKGDSYVVEATHLKPIPTYEGTVIELPTTKQEFHLGDKDKELFMRLVQLGPDHGKTLRQIPIVIDFTAPEFFLKEFDTYKISTVRNSTSMMHILGKEPFKAEMFSWEDMGDEYKIYLLALLNELREQWIAAGKKKGPNQIAWRALLQMVPQSWNYRSSWSGNYQVLRNMYHARKNHRLLEWRMFCDWIETLPYAELIIV